MTDRLNCRVPEDKTKISLNEDWEIYYWSKEIGVTTSQLLSAVATVGIMVDDVRAYFRTAKAEFLK